MYVVSASCVFCRAQSCVSVCPVDCFFADDLQLYIQPEECIFCGACEPECPSLAIRDESEETHADVLRNAERCATGAARRVTHPAATRAPLPDAEHRARRDVLLVEIARAAAAGGREALLPAIESWLPAAPLADDEPRPRGPGGEKEAELLALLQESFPDRWPQQVEGMRALLAPPPRHAPPGEGEDPGSFES